MLHTSSRLASFLAVSSFALLAACNEVETGEYGVVEFVPDDCGQAFCDLDDRLAVDATTDVYLNAADGGSADGLFIRTSSPWIAEVVAEDTDGLSPRVTLAGNAPGEVDLLAIDSWGYIVDYVTIEVAAPDAIGVDVFGSAVDGPHYAAGYDDLYFVDAGAEIEIDAHAYADAGPLMGNMAYTVIIDADLALNVRPGDDLSDGKFRVTVPAGEHDLTIATPSVTRVMRFSVK
jgi:hypothetical protein